MNPADIVIPDEKLIELFSGLFPYRDHLVLYLDVNIDQRIVPLLRAENVTVTDAYQQNQETEKSDIRLLSRARTLGCVMVTKDSDFREIHERITRLEGAAHLGIVLITSDTLKLDPSQLAESLVRLVSKFEGSTAFLRNQVFTI